jgi:hypothetical protein
MGIKVKISGVNLVLSGLDQYSKDVQNLVQEEVRDWAERVESDAKRDTPVKTGDLKNSILAVLGANGLTWIVKVGGINGVNYAPFIVFGTGSFVDDAFLQQYGLVSYAAQFKGAGIREVNLPMRDFLYRNSAIEFEKTFQNIKRLLKASEK